jgi:hypothetical protein
MFDFAKSAVSFAWAMSVVGLQETMAFIQNPQEGRQPDKAASTLRSATHAARNELGDMYKAAFEAGDRVQREMIDSVAQYLTAENFYNPDKAFRAGTDLLWDLSDTMRFFVPTPQTMTAWMELRNKVSVFQLVKDVQATFNIPSDGDFDLEQLVEQAYERGPYPALWFVEGLGHDYADHLTDRGEELKGILCGDRIESVPAKALTMLNAGIGMSFAQQPMSSLDPHNLETSLTETLDQFVQHCKDNATPGYEGAALESLGLVTRTFHAELIPRVDNHLASIGEDIQAYYWHGVGRASYFLLINFLPFGDPVWRAVEIGREQAPHELAKANTLSGTAWALTLVNMRQPEIMASFIRDHGDEIAGQKDAFANGVASSLIMRYDTSPDDPYIESFRNYQPPAEEERLCELWERYIKSPIDQALDEYYEPLKESGKLGQIFRCRSLADLVEE